MTDQVYLSPGVVMCEVETYRALMARRALFDPTRTESFTPVFDSAISRRLYRTENGVAIISIEGYLDQKESRELWWIGGTAYETIVKAIEMALGDPNVRAILLDVLSGGGAASGSGECAQAIRELRGSKPIYSIANSFCCSAAIAVATAADEFDVTQTAVTGSIGCIYHRFDITGYEAKLGMKTHIIKAGSEKGYGDPTVPMTDAEQAKWQEIVNWYYDEFTKCVALNCGVDQSHVLSKWADARIFLGAQAVTVGLAKRVTTLTQLVAELGSQLSPATQKGTQSNGQGKPRSESNRIRPSSRLVPRPAS